MHTACLVVKHPIALNVFFECTLMFSLRMEHAGETLCVCVHKQTLPKQCCFAYVYKHCECLRLMYTMVSVCRCVHTSLAIQSRLQSAKQLSAECRQQPT